MEIKVEIGNWQYNSGIVGLYNILEHANRGAVKLDNNAMYFDSLELENFEEKYFNYLIGIYEKILSWYRIVSFQERVDFFKEKPQLSEEDLAEINNYVKDILKKYLKSNSYIAAYNFIEGDINPIQEEKQLKPIIVKKNEKITDKRDEINKLIEKIEKIIEYFNLKSAKKYIGAKNIIYTIIKNGWDGVSFLNTQTKEKDVYKDFVNYFLNPLREYLDESHDKYKYNCFICNREIKNLNNDFSFLVNTGFDTARKTSHVWNFTNDMAMCPICKLVYSCIPAGFTYMFGAGLFINANTNIGELIRVNTKIKSEISKENSLSGIYRALNKEIQEDIKYELEDIQLVRFEKGKYLFNILSKNMIKVLVDSKVEFSRIAKQLYNFNGERYSLIDEVTRRVLNNENLFTLIHRLIYSKITEPTQFLNEVGIFSTLKINFRMLKGMGYMENNELDILTRARLAGKKIKEKYKDKNSEHKIQSICYRLLNGIKTNNISMTMDTVLNCHLYCDESVPKIIVEMLEDEEKFKEIGYAFISGLLAVEYKEKNEEEGN